MNTLLAFHPLRLGDWLVSIPAIRHLRKQSHVTLGGSARYTDFLVQLGEADAARALDFTALGESMAQVSRYDRLVSWHGHGNVAYTARVMAHNPANVIMVHSRAGEDPSVWKYLLRGVGGDPEAADLHQMPVPPEWTERARRMLEDIGVDPDCRWGLVQIGSADRGRFPKSERLIPLMEQSGCDALVLHQGPGDNPSEFVKDWARPLPTLLEPDLPTLTGLCKLAAVYLGGNTGVMHLSACVGTPIRLTINGPHCLSWIPWGATMEVLDMWDQMIPVQATLARFVAYRKAKQGQNGTAAVSEMTEAIR